MDGYLTGLGYGMMVGGMVLTGALALSARWCAARPTTDAVDGLDVGWGWDAEPETLVLPVAHPLACCCDSCGRAAREYQTPVPLTALTSTAGGWSPR
jgi:hypothetical protein